MDVLAGCCHTQLKPAAPMLLQLHPASRAATVAETAHVGCTQRLLTCAWQMFARGGRCARHCSTLLRKQVLPMLNSPAPAPLGARCHVRSSASTCIQHTARDASQQRIRCVVSRAAALSHALHPAQSCDCTPSCAGAASRHAGRWGARNSSSSTPCAS